MFRGVVLSAALLVLGARGVCAAYTSGDPEFRAYWVDAWHAGFKSASEVTQLINNVHASNCNTVVVQMRRRGDVYYPSVYEPYTSDYPGFDVLRYLLDRCHAANPPIQVHAWLVYLPVYVADTQTFPASSKHPAKSHPEFLTKNTSGSVWHMTGTPPDESYHLNLDPGHPGCEQYLTDLVMELVNNYPDLDGISYDYSRFMAQTLGYNDTSVARYLATYGSDANTAYDYAQWCQWRRDQITNVLRKTYLSAIAANPGICVSSAVVTWDPNPYDVGGDFTRTGPYTSVFQDWDGWMSEGILDLSMPMAYFDRDSAYAPDYDGWINFAKSHSYNRGTVIGPAIYKNDIADSIYQVRQTRDLYGGKAAMGTVMYSYASTNDQGLPNSTFYNALSHPSIYDPNPVPVYDTAVSVPSLPWKTNPTKGHIKGTVTDCAGSALDGVTVSISGPTSRSMVTDGTGFFGFVDLTPGSYTVRIAADPTTNTAANVVAGQVTTADLSWCGAPGITNVRSENVGSSSGQIKWTTEPFSTSRVEYGLTTSYGSMTPLDSAKVKSHIVTVSGLANATTYHYRVRSINSNGLEAVSSDRTFTTLGSGPTEIIIDNLDAQCTRSGTWTAGSYAGGWPDGTGNYHYASAQPAPGNATCTWRPVIGTAGSYDVYVWYVQGSNRSTEAPFTIVYSGGSITVAVNQTTGGSRWNKIGSALPFAAGTSGYVRLGNGTDESSKVVIADAVRFVLVGDTQAPSAPANVQASALSTSQIQITWNPSTDNVGIAVYKVYRAGIYAGSSTTTSFTDGGRTPNTRYSYTVTAYDVAGNESSQSGSVSRYTLSVAPTDDDMTCDRNPSAWYSTAAFTFTSPGFGAGKVSYYRYAWDNSPTHTWTGTETQWTSGSKTVDATSSSQPWYFHARGYNGDNVANGSVDKGPYYCDGDAPIVSEVTAPKYLAVRGSLCDDLRASWTGSDTASGIAEYQYAIGTTAGSTDILGWTSAGTSTSGTYHYPGVVQGGGSFYWSVKAKDQAGNWSAPVGSSASTYANARDTLAEAMANPDATPIILDQAKVVSGCFDGCFYVQEPDRSRGLRVDASAAWQRGSLVGLAGRLITADGERRLESVEASYVGAGRVPRPLALRIAAIGGASPDAYTPGLPGSSGSYNLGLLVRTVGRVVFKGPGYFVLEDGSGATAKVYCSLIPPDSALVGVTGVASVESGMRVIRTRGAEDARVY